MALRLRQRLRSQYTLQTDPTIVTPVQPATPTIDSQPQRRRRFGPRKDRGYIPTISAAIPTDILPTSDLPTSDLPNVRIYVLCHNYERFALAKEKYAKYYWAHPILMKYQDITFENAFWKQLLEIKSEWKECEMVGVISSRAYMKTSITEIDNIIKDPKKWSGGYYNFMDTPIPIGDTHKETKSVCIEILRELKLTPTTEAHCNYWMTTPALMHAFIKWYNDILKPIVLRNQYITEKSNYSGSCNTGQLLRLCGVPYYPLAPFVIERLNKLFFSTYTFPYVDKIHHQLNADILLCHIHITGNTVASINKRSYDILNAHRLIVTYTEGCPKLGDNHIYIKLPSNTDHHYARAYVCKILLVNRTTASHILFLDDLTKNNTNTFLKSIERISLIKSLLTIDNNLQYISPIPIEVDVSGVPILPSTFIVHKACIDNMSYQVLLGNTFDISSIVERCINQTLDYLVLSETNTIDTYDIKLNAIYFPQFHDIPENNKFWGNGFTEWSLLKPEANTLKTSKGVIPIYKPHQTIGYYSLDNSETLTRQIKQAEDNCVNGFIIYHYWFSDTQKVMYKPLERFLDDTIRFPFCIAWANENWTRRWDGLSSNLLIEQKYQDHSLHIDYLLKFMKMPNYIKNNAGEHIIYIYNISSIPKYDEMIDTWRKAAGNEGIKIKIVAFENSNKENDLVTCVQKYAFEPIYTASRYLDITTNGNENSYSIKDIIEKYKSKTYNSDKHLGMTVGWNNSVRRKNLPFWWMSDCTIESMKELLTLLIAKHVYKFKNMTHIRPIIGSENFININAWNEWNEQAILEPTQQDDTKILDMIKHVVTNI
jgi:hypothetical protein